MINFWLALTVKDNTIQKTSGSHRVARTRKYLFSNKNVGNKN